MNEPGEYDNYTDATGIEYVTAVAPDQSGDPTVWCTGCVFTYADDNCNNVPECLRSRIWVRKEPPVDPNPL